MLRTCRHDNGRCITGMGIALQSSARYSTVMHVSLPVFSVFSFLEKSEALPVLLNETLAAGGCERRQPFEHVCQY